MREETLYWIWLQRAVGAGGSAVARLLRTFSTVEQVYEADRTALKRAGVSGNALEALCRKDLQAAMERQERSAELGWILTFSSELYPEPLRHLYSPPLVLYGRGRIPDFCEAAVPAIAVVGTRDCTDYGARVAAALSAGLATVGCPIISGGARGIDRAAHEGALSVKGTTVIVQACGLNVNYPAANGDLRQRVLENGGAVITEFAPGTEVNRGNFHVRNRLISGLARGVCVVEAPHTSGALIAARAARDQGKDVFVVPGRATDETSAGSHALIREGATLVTDPSDVLSEYPQYFNSTMIEAANSAQVAYYTQPVAEPPLLRVADASARSLPSAPIDDKPTGDPVACPLGVSDAARRIYEATKTATLSAEEICAKLKMAPGEVFASLTQLELFGCMECYPGKRYRVKQG